jgi:hypothetical protein
MNMAFGVLNYSDIIGKGCIDRYIFRFDFHEAIC